MQAKNQQERSELLLWAAARGLLADVSGITPCMAMHVCRTHARPSTPGMALGVKHPCQRPAGCDKLPCIPHPARHTPLCVSMPPKQAAELLAQGADPEARDKRHLTPSHYAAAHGHLPLLQYLAAKGVDLEVEDLAGRTPLHLAAAGV